MTDITLTNKQMAENGGDSMVNETSRVSETDEQQVQGTEASTFLAGDDEEHNDASGVASDDDDDECFFTTVDPETNDWDIADENRATVRFLDAELWVHLEYDLGQSATTEDPELAFDSHPLFGAQSNNTEMPSIADEFPSLEILQVHIHCAQDPSAAQHDVTGTMDIRHVRDVFANRVIAPLLAGRVRWAREVEMRIAFTHMNDMRLKDVVHDRQTRTHWQMAYTAVNNPGAGVVIGRVAAEESV
ncbi:hypothetical protein LTR08_001519 [Meristemomyces frigidus]|nr:hypothetical protein LTR08_001519 [Meristemomyces frigidus]